MINSPRLSARGFPIAPLRWTSSNLEEWIRSLAVVINGILEGHSNATGTVTLTASAASTTLSDRFIGYDTKIILTPHTANAAAALATTYMTWPNTTAGQAVINHANNAQTDRTFGYVIQG